MTYVLISGGAGSIGTALVRHLVEVGGYKVTALDDLSTQVHGPGAVFSRELQSTGHSWRVLLDRRS